MAARVQDLVEDNRLLSGAVSHDLRTPLARLRFGVGALAEGPPEAERERYLRWLEEDVGSMEELVDVLLEFTRLGGGPERAASSDLALEPLIGDGVAHARTTSGREIRWHPGAGHAVRAHAPHVRMLVINLLQNAARHAGSRVEVGLARRGARVVLTVEDDGPGIAPADRARVLRPFERGRSACARGHGLGLAIVQRVAERYGATLAIDASPTLGGARIEGRVRGRLNAFASEQSPAARAAPVAAVHPLARDPHFGECVVLTCPAHGERLGGGAGEVERVGPALVAVPADERLGRAFAVQAVPGAGGRAPGELEPLVARLVLVQRDAAVRIDAQLHGALGRAERRHQGEQRGAERAPRTHRPQYQA